METRELIVDVSAAVAELEPVVAPEDPEDGYTVMTETKTVPIMPPSSSVKVVVTLIGYGGADVLETLETVPVEASVIVSSS